MSSQISRNSDNTITVSVTFSPGRSMLETEELLQAALNEAGALATGECLKDFDSDGGTIVIAGKKLTVKGGGKMPKKYQTPYGETTIDRFVYQSSAGGAIYCPLEANARIVRTATPLLAKQVSFKYGICDSSEVVADFAQHGRTLSRSYVREISADVASIRSEKQDVWNFEIPSAAPGDQIKTIAVGVDGTSVLLAEDGWRQVMVGTIALYNQDSDRVDTIYIANAPESGKATFFKKMEHELERVRERYPDARYVGIADGAHDGWNWLQQHTSWQILDFWHASEYINSVAPAFERSPGKQKAWIEDACHRLKHDYGAALAILEELRQVRETSALTKAIKDNVDKTITYLENQIERMNYPVYKAMGFPIGSGVTEAACKCIAKERLCGSGMRWSQNGSEQVLSLRTLIKSTNRWNSFWQKISQHGFSKITRRPRPLSNKK